MKKNEILKKQLKLIAAEAAANANCKRISEIFLLCDWHWAGGRGEESYIPLSRDIRRAFHELSDACIDSTIKHYEEDTWTGEQCTVEGGRLFFTLEWYNEDPKQLDIIRDLTMTCGIKDENVHTCVNEATDEQLDVETFTDREEEIKQTYYL